MTAQILAAELGNLITDSKRKNSELRNASDKSLQDLKSLPNTSETQLAADLSRRPHFITPFLIACGTHNAKFASTGLSCLQRLSVARALPRERLKEVLDALRESANSSHDIQLKILQCLPSLLQNYQEIHGELLASVLQICSGLQTTKNFAVSNTAAATLQQLVIAVFDRVSTEDERTLEIPTVTSVQGDNGQVQVRSAAHDAYKVFNDLIFLVMGEKCSFVRFATLPPSSTLELIEAVLSNHYRVVTSHPEQIYLLRTSLLPLVIRSLSDRLSFPVTVRIVRILNLIIRHHLHTLHAECEIALGLLNHMLDPEASQQWKRALCLEVFRGIYSDYRLLLAIYSHYDAQEGKKNIFGDNLAAFVRLAVEKPAVIGLGQQSTIPSSFDDAQEGGSDQAVAEAGALAGMIGGSVSDNNHGSRPAGISMQWSSMKTPCIEHLDKSDPPALPDTYIYGLVLTCITNISESLAKFVLPLTVHQESRGRKKSKGEEPTDTETDANPSQTNLRQLSRTHSFRKKTIPVNPLDLTDHSAYTYVQTSSMLVTECWPAVLATCSTFLNAALDADYYRALVRAIQKFTHVAGLLRQATPRDAFLTTMGKAAVPSNLFMANIASPKSASGDKSSLFANAKGLLSVDSLVNQGSTASADAARRPSHDISAMPSLGPRNLLCLRALLNLAIALGPTLQTAWSIIFETLQVADLVLSLASQSGSRTPVNRSEAGGSSDKLDAEISAVQAAARRLFESTADYPNESFVEVLQALCALLNTAPSNENDTKAPSSSNRPKVLHQRRLGSVSGISLSTETNSRDAAFALNKIGELASLNESRLAQFEPEEGGWELFVSELVKYTADERNATPTRLLAADILSRTVREIAESSMSDAQQEDIQARILAALQRQISALHHDHSDEGKRFSEANVRVHQIALEALKNVIEQCGESLVAGWGSVLDSLQSVFTLELTMRDNVSVDKTKQGSRVQVISRSLARSAFASANLICSDFLIAVPHVCLSTLLDLLLNFCYQQEDLNMSLTAITFFWKVSDFLASNREMSLPKLLEDAEFNGETPYIVSSTSQEGQLAALWLQVLLRLSSITTDERAEVRHSAVQTIQRIFEHSSDHLSPDIWLFCLRTVLFKMVETNIQVQSNLRATPQHIDLLKDWNDTTKVILQTVSLLNTAYMEKLNASQFTEAWSELLGFLQQYFEHGSHALGTSVLNTITEVLSHLHDDTILEKACVSKTATVWQSYFKSRDTWAARHERNQEAFTAYADAFKAIYGLSDNSTAIELPQLLANLEACVVDSDAEAYSSDIDSMTTVQSRVMECLRMVRTQGPELPSYLIQLLGRFILLPYASWESEPENKGPTFVALSKTAMGLLQDVTVKHIDEKEIFSSGAYLRALQSLAKPIQEKYVWHREGRSPTLWQKAGSTAIAILKSGLPQAQNLGMASPHIKEVWPILVDIASYVTRAQVKTDPSLIAIEQDEAKDIESFKELRALMTAYLGSSQLTDSLRRTYSRNLFSTSLVHVPMSGELPALASSPLEGLYKVRLGQTAELPLVLRTEMSFVCLSELFDLVETHDGSPDRIKLAQATAPYLIVRAALPLKTFIADHPLRGRLPMPESQRRELLFVLKRLGDLESEPQAIPNAPNIKSEHKKHLHRLYPLLIQALRVARHDAEVFEQLTCLVDMVGDDLSPGE